MVKSQSSGTRSKQALVSKTGKFKIPKKVKILGETWKVSTQKDWIKVNDKNAHGSCDPVTSQIKIKLDGNVDRTFFHELAHAYRFRLGRTQNEEIIQGESFFWYQMFLQLGGVHV